MGRAKVKLELIVKERSRNTTFQRRKKGLKKKMYEFSTLCGAEACLIILGPNQLGDQRLVEPETWPENQEDVLNIIDQYKRKQKNGFADHDGPGNDKRRHVTIPDLLEDQTKKVRSELVELRQRKDNKGKYPTWDDRLNNFSVDQLEALVGSLDSKLDLVNLMIDLKEGNHSGLDDIVTGLIGYSVPPLDQNHPPSAPLDMDHSGLDDIVMIGYSVPLPPLNQNYPPPSPLEMDHSGLDDIITGLMGYSVPPLNQSPPSSPPLDEDLSLMDEIEMYMQRPQPPSFLPIDHVFLF